MSKHLKRLRAPSTWNILRKATKYIAKPLPGPHNNSESMTVDLVLKQLGYSQTLAETKHILNAHPVLRDGARVLDPKSQIGILDTLSLPLSNEYYRMVFDAKGRLHLISIPKNEAGSKPCKVVNKTPVRKGKIQCNLNDGRNILADKSAPKTGDTLIIETPSQKISQSLPMEKGASIYLMGGKHVGTLGVLQSIDKDSITFTANNATLATAKKYALVVGKDKPVLKLQ